MQVIHRGNAKRTAARQNPRLKRRQAIEPLIGHVKADHRMDKCWLKSSVGDALHAVLSAARIYDAPGPRPGWKLSCSGSTK